MADEDIIDKPKRAKMCGRATTVNPLLIDLVLEKVFPYCVVNTRKGNWTSLTNFRFVCKDWDKELVKLIRPATEINLLRLVTPYPDGLGWTENGKEAGGGCYYQCPYPITVPHFENILVAGNCKNLMDSRVIRYFQVMGGTIKKLSFVSSLTCFHHVRFLECVLKLWCPNLKTLELNGVICVYTLVHNSKFVDSSNLVCDLKEVVLLLNGDEDYSLYNFKACQNLVELSRSYLNYDNTSLTLKVSDDTTFPSFGLSILKRLSRNFQAEITQDSLDFISKVTGNDGGGGVLGQILKTAGVEKLVIKKLSIKQYPDFVGFLNFRQIGMRKTLKHLEFDHFPLALDATNLAAFRILKFPLVSIRFGVLFACQIRNGLRDLIASYADTLEHLEFTGNVVLQDWYAEQEEEYIEITMPFLPKLKTFVNGNIFACRMAGLDFLKKMPNLEKCKLTNAIYHSSIYPLTPAEVFNMLFQACQFDETFHPLKELVLDGKLSYNNHLDLMHAWFPQLRKVELVLDGADVFVDFLRVAKNLNLEDVKVSFHENDNEWCNLGIMNNVGRMTGLKYLQLIHLPDFPLIIQAKTCEEGFAKIPRLSSLKLTNFGVYTDELQRIRSSLSHISCVQMSRTVLVYKPVDVEFSVGVETSFPSHQFPEQID